MTNVFSFGISNDARKSKDKAMELASNNTISKIQKISLVGGIEGESR